MEHSGEQSRRKRHADDPEVPHHTFEGSPETNVEHKSKRVRDREEADSNLLYRDDSEYLYWADACGTCSLFPPSDDYQKSSLCTADRKDEIALGDGFVADEIWMSPVSIDYGANDGFLENASVLSNDSEVCTSSMEKGTEEAFNEVREWLLSEESSPSYTANSLSCCTQAEACCMAQALKGVARNGSLMGLGGLVSCGDYQGKTQVQNPWVQVTSQRSSPIGIRYCKDSSPTKVR